MWVARELALALQLEEALRRELFLQPLEGCLQRAHALQLRAADDELILPARLIDRHVAGEQHLLAVGEQRAMRDGRVAEEHARELRARVLEREVNVPGRLRAEVGDFAGDGDLPDLLLQQPLDVPGQLRDGQHLAHGLRREEFAAEVPLRFGWFGHRWKTI